MLEVGSHLGASALYLAVAATVRKGRLYCVDTWLNDAMTEGQKDTWADFSENVRPLGLVITPIRSSSTRFDKTLIKSPLDFVFIDGDHSYDGVKRDFEYLQPLFSDYPTIAFHDTTGHRGVARFLGELLQSGDWSLRGVVNSLAWIERARWQPTSYDVTKKSKEAESVKLFR